MCAAERQAEVRFGRDLECLRAQRLGPIEMPCETVRFRQKRGEPGFEGSQSELVQRRDGLLERVDGAREIALLQIGVPEEAGRDRAVQGVSRLLNGPLTVRDAVLEIAHGCMNDPQNPRRRTFERQVTDLHRDLEGL